MNDTMLQRLFWKEYRTQRGFWLGVAGMGLVLQLIVLMVTGEIEIRTSTLFYISFVMPVFYALGSTAMTFAAEREEGTWNRLRILAASPGRLFLAKFGFSVVSTLMMAAVLVLLSWGMADGRIPGFRPGMIDTRPWMLAAGEFLVWGTFISLLTRRVLSAVFLTPVCALSFAAIASSGYEQFGTIRLSMMAFLLLASIGLSRRWLKRETLGWPVPWSISLRRKQADFLTAVETGSPQKRLFQRLTWQERRQACANCFVFLVIGLPLVAASYWSYYALRVDFAAIVISLVPLLCGVWVFRGEQEGKRFRYLSECGVTPQTVWLSKQRVWMTATIILVSLFVITDLYASSFHPDYFHKDVLSVYQKTLNEITGSTGSRHVLPVFILYCLTT
ncbi:MAG: ABC transporter permease, partial [Planctomycetes bacterium]|nr:ABC transporter permease [Planctomycetota bacterium]